MSMLASAFSDLLAPGFKKIYFDGFKMYPEEYSSVFNVMDSKRNYEKVSQIAGFPTMAEKTAGGSITYEDMIQGYDKTLTHVTYAIGFRISQELWEDDLYGVMNRAPAATSKSTRQSVEVLAATHYNNAFSTTGPDGKALCATDHPLLGGGTESNRAATSADLDMTSLQALIQLMEETVDDQGIQLNIKPKTLVVPLGFMWTARELLDSTDKPTTANRAINPLKDDELRYFVYHYLTDEDAYFLLADKPDHPMTFIWRRRPDMENGADFDTGDAKFKSTMRCVSGFHAEWRGIVGNPGV